MLVQVHNMNKNNCRKGRSDSSSSSGGLGYSAMLGHILIKARNLFRKGNLIPKICSRTGYVYVYGWTDGPGVWVLEGTKENHDKFHEVSNVAEDWNNALKMVGAVFYEYCKIALAISSVCQTHLISLRERSP